MLSNTLIVCRLTQMATENYSTWFPHPLDLLVPFHNTFPKLCYRFPVYIAIDPPELDIREER